MKESSPLVRKNMLRYHKKHNHFEIENLLHAIEAINFILQNRFDSFHGAFTPRTEEKIFT